MPTTYFPRCRVVLEVLLEDFADGSGEQTASFELIPRSAEWERNGRREADTCRLELDWRDFPLDPRSCRSILVALFCADVGEPTGQIDLSNPEHQVFLGFIDAPEATLEESGELVMLTGRDYTALFLDYTWGGGALDISRPLSEVVAVVVATVPGTGELQTRFTEGAEGIILAELVGKTKFAPQSGDDAWTVLLDLVGRAGLLAVIELDTLHIRPPFESQDTQVGFLYGRDIERLTYRRKFNEWKTRQVEVVCWDPTTRESRVAIHPPEPIILRKRIGSDGKVTPETAPKSPFFVEGTYTDAQLADIARRLWEEVARAEVEGDLTTREMRDLDFGTTLPLLSAGDQLQVALGVGLSGLSGMSEQEAAAALEASGMKPEVAEALILSWRNADRLATSFFIRSAEHRWSQEEGYQLRIAFLNYVGSVA